MFWLNFLINLVRPLFFFLFRLKHTKNRLTTSHFHFPILLSYFLNSSKSLSLTTSHSHFPILLSYFLNSSKSLSSCPSSETTHFFFLLQQAGLKPVQNHPFKLSILLLRVSQFHFPISLNSHFMEFHSFLSWI